MVRIEVQQGAADSLLIQFARSGGERPPVLAAPGGALNGVVLLWCPVVWCREPGAYAV